jgi:putative aldouronate transport system permease protein
MAFQSTDKYFNTVFTGLNNFERVWAMLAESKALLGYIKNSLYIFILSFLIGFPLNMLFSYMFYVKMRGAGVFRFLIMLPAMISGLVTAMLYSKFAEYALPVLFKNWFGVETVSLLKDSRFNLNFLLLFGMLTGFSSNVIIYTNSMNAIDDSIIESAQIDGASGATVLLKILMPNIHPTITTFIVTGVAGLFAGDGGAFLFYEYNAPENVFTTGYFMFMKSMKASELDYSFAAALGLLFTLITLPLTLIVKSLMEKTDPTKEV